MGDALTRADDPAYVQKMADGLMLHDLNAELVRNKAATFFPEAPDSTIEGINRGDLLIVDRSLKPRPNTVIFAEVAGEYCLRRLLKHGDMWLLGTDAQNDFPLPMTENEYYHGTVTAVIHRMQA